MQERPAQVSDKVYGGRFKPIKEVGYGGMGAVYLARDEKTEAKVALKVLFDREGPNAERFSQESALLAELTHPAIVRYIDHGVTPGGEHYLAMEWLDGHSLEERLTGGALSVVETAALAARLLGALANAHRRGIVHRDLKPENLFLPEGHLTRAKLLDFGIARRIYDQRRITRAGSTLGTPMYMSPEQARGQGDIDHRADIFSLGCVLYECLTGRPPFVGDTSMAVLAKICLEPPKRASKLNPDIPPSFEAIVNQMLSKNREDRPHDTALFARELSAYEETLRAAGAKLADEEKERARLRTPSSLTVGEQRLFSVVMVQLPRKRAGVTPGVVKAVDENKPRRTPMPSGTYAAVTPPVASAPGGKDFVANRGTPALGMPAADMTTPRGTPAVQTTPPLGTAAASVPVGGYTPGGGVANPMFTPPEGVGAARPGPKVDKQLERLRRALSPYDVKIDRLYNGSLVVTQTADGNPVEQAVRGARAALTLKALLPKGSLALCTARTTGGETLPIGHVLERAGRLVMRSDAGHIELDDASAELLDSRFETHRIADAGSPRAQLLFEKGLREPPRTVLGKQLPCVGRDRELSQLENLYDEVVDDEVARVALVISPAGGGKSRVRHEFLERIQNRGERMELLIARGDPLRAGAPFGLLGGAIRAACNLSGAEEEDVQRKRLRAHVGRNLKNTEKDPKRVARIVAFIGEIAGIHFPDDDLPSLKAARQDPRLMADQTRLSFLDWIEADLEQAPVVLLFEDLHWGDVPSIELADAALKLHEEKSLLVVGFARPAVDENFAGLWESHALERITLPPLTQKAGQRLARELLPDLKEDDIAAIVARADGNPFFLEEIVRQAVEAGEDFSTDKLPTGIFGVLQARLDALGEDGKRILRAASIFGQTFRRAGVAELLGERAAEDAAHWIDILSDKEIIYPRTAGTVREFSFRHALVRDASYETLTEADRKRGHLRAGQWLAEEGEHDAIVLVHHFEQGEERKTAAHYCRVAAEQAYDANDLQAVVDRAERGVRNGVGGEELGLTRLVQAQAETWRGNYPLTEKYALEAESNLKDANRFSALGERINALAHLGDFDGPVQVLNTIETEIGAEDFQKWAACLVAASHVLLMGRRFDTSAKCLLLVEKAFLRSIRSFAGSVFVAKGCTEDAFGGSPQRH